MEGHCSTGQSPQWAVVPMEEEQEQEEQEKQEEEEQEEEDQLLLFFPFLSSLSSSSSGHDLPVAWFSTQLKFHKVTLPHAQTPKQESHLIKIFLKYDVGLSNPVISKMIL